MKALSLTRPWTELVLAGVKDIENRTWPTRHRGWLVIHGAKSYDKSVAGFVALLERERRLSSADIAALDTCLLDADTADTGYLGVVRVIDCHESGDLDCYARGGRGDGRCSPWAFLKQHHWVVEDALRFAVPIPGRGRLGVFDVPPDVSDEIQRICPGILDT